MTDTLATPLPMEGYLRLRDIIGNRKRGIPAVIPVSATTWWEGVRTHRFPKPRKLGPHTTVWLVGDIRRLIESHSERSVHTQEIPVLHADKGSPGHSAAVGPRRKGKVTRVGPTTTRALRGGRAHS